MSVVIRVDGSHIGNAADHGLRNSREEPDGVGQHSREQMNGTVRPFIPRVESLRGLAALMVAGYHSIMLMPIDGIDYVRGIRWADVAGFSSAVVKSLFFLYDGRAAVAMFFVISGLVLGLSLDKAHGRLAAGWGAFLIRRLCRIYPALIISTCLIALSFLFLNVGPEPFGTTFFNFYRHEVTIQNVVANLLLEGFEVNPVTWTIQVELYASLLLPVFHYLSRKGPLISDLLLLALLLVFSYHYPDDGIRQWFFAFYLGLMLPKWGGLLGHVFANSQKVAGVFLCLAAVLWLGMSYLPYEWQGTRTFMTDLSARDALAPILQTIGAALVLGTVVYGPELRIFRVLDSRLVRFYGRMSYSFYLYHYTVLYALALLVMRSLSPFAPIPHAIGIQVGLFLLSIAATTPIAWLSYLTVERYFVALGRKTAGRHATEAPVKVDGQLRETVTDR